MHPILNQTIEQTPWPESASELYRPPLVDEVSANFIIRLQTQAMEFSLVYRDNSHSLIVQPVAGRYTEALPRFKRNENYKPQVYNQESFWGYGAVGRRVRLPTSPPSVIRAPRKCRTTTSRNTIGLHGLSG
jgi:hypothetical protein